MLERVGQTEAAVDLARLAGLIPAGVICEIMNDDGTMARGRRTSPPTASSHGLKMITVADLVAYRRRHEKLVERVVVDRAADRVRRVRRRRLPLAGRQQAPRRAGQGRGRRRRGRARPRPLRVPDRRRLPLAALRLRRAARVGAVDDRAARAAACCSTSARRAAGSACSTSCGPTSSRRRASTRSTPTSGSGLPADLRDYGIGAQILVDLGLTSIRILTNNPKKISGLAGYGLSVTDQIPIEHVPNPHNEAYLRAKRDRLGPHPAPPGPGARRGDAPRRAGARPPRSDER